MHRRRGFLWFVLGLIALNWLSLLLFQPSSGQPRVTVPFNPCVPAGRPGRPGEVDLDQGRHASKARSHRRCATRRPTRTRRRRRSSRPRSRRSGTAAQLSALLRSKGVQINAKPTTSAPSLLAELLLGFGPTLLIVGPVRAARPSRRESGRRDGRAGQLRTLAGPPRGPREDPRDVRRRRRHRRGQARALGDRRLPARPRALRAASAGACRMGCCCRARRAPARRCSRGPSPARRTRPSSRSRPRSSSRRSSASARRACATCSRRPRRRRRRSSSSTRSTRSGARVRARCR